MFVEPFSYEKERGRKRTMSRPRVPRFVQPAAEQNHDFTERKKTKANKEKGRVECIVRTQECNIILFYS